MNIKRFLIRSLIFVVGIVVIPFIWLGLNLFSFFERGGYISLWELYRDFVDYYPSGLPFGYFDSED